MTRELGPAFDLLAAYDPSDGFFMERDGFGVATAGEALRIEVAPGEQQPARAADEVREALDRLAGEAIVPAVAVGALPFEATRTATFVVPGRAVIRREDRVTREISISEEAARDDRPVVGSAPSAPFQSIQMRQEPPADAYADGVRAAVAMIHAGAIRKVVLARTLEVDAGRALDPRQLLQRLRAVDPSAYAFAVRADEESILVGASPELLVSRSGRKVSANPLAGSAPRSGDRDQDRANAESLAADGKNQMEHAIVVESVAAALEPMCDELVWDKQPTLLATANVWHLSTRFQGVLREPVATSLELVAALHPTPAVGGDPAPAARAAIRELESFERGLYAGPVGWMDAGGDGEWALALRCALLSKESATLYAGAGIVAGSDPLAEVEETDGKFRAFLDSLRWG